MVDEPEDEGRFRRRGAAGPPVRRGFGSRVGWWLVGAAVTGIVPLAVALWALSLARVYAPWLAQATQAGASGSAVVVTVTFSIALLVEFWLFWKVGPSAGSADGVPIRGWRQFFLTYVLVPLVPGLVVGYLTWSPATHLAQAIDWIRQPSGPKVERQVGDAIRSAEAPDTRVAGLRALAEFGSPDALSELARMATSDPGILTDPASFTALVAALASFGGACEPVLGQISEQARQPGGSNPASGAPTPIDVVLATYDKLETIANTDLAYGIAREAAFAPSSSPARQAAALAVIAKSGSRSDFVLLASFLTGRPEPVKQAALDALRRLDARLKRQEPPPPSTNAAAPPAR